MSAPTTSTGTSPSSSLPIISIAPWLPPSFSSSSSSSSQNPTTKNLSEKRAETSRALHQACLTYGFFYLDITSISSLNSSESESSFMLLKNELDELEDLARKFFAIEQVKKDNIGIGKGDGVRGYQRLNENITQGKSDSHEGLDVYRPVSNPDPSRPLWGNNQWPSEQDVPQFKQKFERWVGRMKELGAIVIEAMAAGLGLTPEELQDLESKTNDSFWIFRVIGYPPLPLDHDGISCGAHKDYGCLTFLYTDSTRSALQVFLDSEDGKSGDGRWINVDPIPGCLIVNIGEMWEIWTAGLYKSTLHRVIHRGDNYRISIPFFYEPNFDAIINPLPTAAAAAAALHTNNNDNDINNGNDNNKSPKKTYEPVHYGDFLMKKVTSNFTGGGKYA